MVFKHLIEYHVFCLSTTRGSSLKCASVTHLISFAHAHEHFLSFFLSSYGIFNCIVYVKCTNTFWFTIYTTVYDAHID